MIAKSCVTNNIYAYSAAEASGGHSSSSFSDPGPSNSHSKQTTYSTTREGKDTII